MNMWHALRLVAVASTAVAGLVSSAPISEARERGDGYGSVTAVSRYGNRSLTAPVRRGRFGPEVNIGHNTWLSCAADCANTLRREKVDFWETKREDGGGGGRR